MYSIDGGAHEPNEVARNDRDEHRAAIRRLTETERAQDCRHDVGRSGACQVCGEQVVGWEDA